MRAKSAAVEVLRMSSPVASWNMVSVMPRLRALRFMRSTKVAVPPGNAVRASVAAARFSDDIKASSSISLRLSVVPTARREEVFFTRSISASDTVTSWSSEAPESIAPSPSSAW